MPAARRAIVRGHVEPVWQRRRWRRATRASPYRRLLRASADAVATHGSPIEANAVALGLAAGSRSRRHARSDILRGTGAASWAASELEPWDHRLRVSGAAARRLDRSRPASTCSSTLNRRVPGVARRRPARASGSRYDVAAAARPAGRSRSRSRIGMGLGRRGRQRLGTATVGLRDLRGGRPRQPARAAPRERPRASQAAGPRHDRRSSSARSATRAFLEGTADILGWDVDRTRAWQRHWLGDGRDAARRRSLDRYGGGHARHLSGRCSRSSCIGTRSAARTMSGRRSRPTASASSRTRDGRGGRCAASSSTRPGYMANYALSAIVAAAVRGPDPGKRAARGGRATRAGMRR